MVTQEPQPLPELRRSPRELDARPLLVLAAAVEERHPDLADHGDRVADLATEVGRRLGLGRAQVGRLRLAARLHDVGKVAVPQEILDKPGRLDADEWRQMERHPEVGAQLLASSNLDALAPIVEAHHERPDGTGYPHRLTGADIPLEALIIGAADAFDAMVSARPYRRPLTTAAALAELDRGAGTQFDPQIASALHDSIVARDGNRGRRFVARARATAAVY